MPRGKNHRAARRFIGPEITKSQFRTFFLQSIATASTQFAQLDLVLSNLGDRALDIGENFEFFRVTSIRIAAIVGNQTTNAGGGLYQAVSFVNTPKTDQVAPTSNGLMTQHEYYSHGSAFHKISVVVGRRALLDQPNKWFNTTSTGSVPAATRSVGTVTAMLALSATGTVTSVDQMIVVEGDIEYHTPIDFSDSFHLRIPRLVRAEPTVEKAVSRLKDAVAAAEGDS